jgi:hypothetical protein
MLGNVKTKHVKVRQQQRGLRDDVLQFILDFGHVEYRQGHAYYCLRERLLPRDLSGSRVAEMAKPWGVVTRGLRDVVITAYPACDARRRARQLSRRCRFRRPAWCRRPACA